ncbi:MAG: CHAT domain-containing protein [Bacteroidota bacterium]
MDISIDNPYKKEKNYSRLEVEILNGHLKYTKYPLMIGHFTGDDILSTEGVVDFLYDKELSNRNKLGAYPSHLGTSLYIHSEKSYLNGALVVGMGPRNSINVQRLQFAVEQAILSFLLNKDVADKSGIASILIGSGYGGIITTECVNAIITGVANANERILEVYPDHQTISTLSLIELYKDKAEMVYEYINENKVIFEEMNVFLKSDLKQVQGYVQYRKYQSDKRWWYNITVNQCFEKNEPIDQFNYSVSSKIARVETITLDVDKEEVNLLLGQIDSDKNWQQATIQAAFRMMIPKEIIRLISSNTGIVWTLDKHTAVYPWELIFMERIQDKPVSVQAGMIRQLMINDPKPVKYVNSNKVCIIADPILSTTYIEKYPEVKKMAQLPSAVKEGYDVINTFKAFDCITTDLINQTYAEIYPKLILEKHRLLHIACHGVVNWGPNNKTGIVFDYQSILTAEKLSNLEYMPEFVFLNCCYSGYISNMDKNKFSATAGIALIENGVKAVIVGAWAIDDQLARKFAAEFYSYFLKGDYFGEAVRKARESIYNESKNDNTWAAYQCYGNQYYTFKLSRRTSKEVTTKNYQLKKEIHQDLEQIHNNTYSARKRSFNTLGELEEIKKAVQNNKLVDEEILEKLAKLFAENGDYKNAIDLYQMMSEVGRLHHSVWAQNFSKVINAKYIIERCKEETAKVERARRENSPELKDVEKKAKAKRAVYLNKLTELRKEAEVLYKRDNNKSHIIMYTSILKSSLIANEHHFNSQAKLSKKRKEDFINDLGYIAQLYLEAYQQDNSKKDSHTLCAAIYAAQTYLSVKEVKDYFSTVLGEDIDTYLAYLLQDIKKDQNRRSWDLIKPINVYEAQLLLAENDKKVVNEVVKNIRSLYTEFWASGGSKRNVMAEVDQITFLLAANAITGQLADEKVEALKDLKKFYQNLIIK